MNRQNNYHGTATQTRSGNFNQQKGAYSEPFVNRFKNDWITNRINTECIAFAEEFGKELVDKKFSTSQIRNVFGEIRRIQMNEFDNNHSSFLLLKPKIAYATARMESLSKASKDGARIFREVFMKAHEAVKADETGAQNRFVNFCDFLEAVLAFHKVAETERTY